MQKCLIELNRSDEPVIKGTDVTVASVLERLSSDDNIETICSDQHLTREQVHAALSYAEINLPQPGHSKAPGSMLSAAMPNSDDRLDYTLLAENAGYFSTDAGSLHLLHAS